MADGQEYFPSSIIYRKQRMANKASFESLQEPTPSVRPWSLLFVGVSRKGGMARLGFLDQQKLYYAHYQAVLYLLYYLLKLK
jgi:hypothetical protein